MAQQSFISGTISNTTSSTRVLTKYFENVFDKDLADFAFEYLKDSIQWMDGIKTRTGNFTRKQKALRIDDDDIVFSMINRALDYIKLHFKCAYLVDGVYLNYYRNGLDYTPMHSHDTCQMIISLGCQRCLRVGTKDYYMNHGSVCIFGKSSHGVREQPEIQEGRISIAVFLREVNMNLDLTDLTDSLQRIL